MPHHYSFNHKEDSAYIGKDVKTQENSSSPGPQFNHGADVPMTGKKHTTHEKDSCGGKDSCSPSNFNHKGVVKPSC
jgi:hypothetical protein